MADQSSRRSFLRHASLGSTALGATILLPATLGNAASARARATHDAAANHVDAVRHEGPLMAYVKNARTGEIAVMVGEREVVRHDPQLAAQLSRIAAGATP
ncbi:hypothetical protein [Streptacidiphilus sp. EB129]|uniref:hypothetical protein n=1 Tax=Streptacidiphilus sp. EB129 TaxID=3156262 RepID=UPI0035161043